MSASSPDSSSAGSAKVSRTFSPDTALQSPDARIGLVDISLIDPNPFQHRQTMDEQKMEELTAAIQSQGLLQRVLLRPVGDRYQLVFGHRRKEAFSRLLAQSHDARWAQIPAVIRTGMTDQEMQLFNLSENLSVEDPPVIELAMGIAQYQRINNLTLAQVAERLGQKEMRVKRLLRLTQAPTVLRNACSDGMVIEDGDEEKPQKTRRRLDMMACLELMKLYKHYQTADAFSADGKVGALVEKVLSDGWSFQRVSTYVDEVVNAPVGSNPSAEASANANPPMKVTAKQVTIYFDRIGSATPSEKKEIRKQVEELLRQVG